MLVFSLIFSSAEEEVYIWRIYVHIYTHTLRCNVEIWMLMDNTGIRVINIYRPWILCMRNFGSMNKYLKLFSKMSESTSKPSLSCFFSLLFHHSPSLSLFQGLLLLYSIKFPKSCPSKAQTLSKQSKSLRFWFYFLFSLLSLLLVCFFSGLIYLTIIIIALKHKYMHFNLIFIVENYMAHRWHEFGRQTRLPFLLAQSTISKNL